jgi:FKBP-type peptidyl-prolyl cis-trans isomerase
MSMARRPDPPPPGFLVLQSDELIEGLQAGVIGMRAGELRRITVPPRLGYQSRRVGAIPRDATLRFDVELVRIGAWGAS